MKALVINCTLKSSPEPSNTAALVNVVIEELEKNNVQVECIRLADHYIPPGVSNQEDEKDEWLNIHKQLLEVDILIIASPTWLGHPSSLAQRTLERMDAMISETRDDKKPVAYGKVAGVVVTGNEDGAHHVISEISGALIDIGYTIPGQAWTYWNRGPGPSKSYLNVSPEVHEWSHETGKTAAKYLVEAAKALVPLRTI